MAATASALAEIHSSRGDDNGGQCQVIEDEGCTMSVALFALADFAHGAWRFIAAVEGLRALDKASGEMAVFRSGAWEKGQTRAAKLSIGGNQVVGERGAAVADPAGGTIVDAEARAAIAAILARLRQHGLIAS